MRNHNSVKAPILLKTILDILFWILIIGLAGGIMLTTASYFFDAPIDIKINNHVITKITLPIFFALLIKIVVAVVFIYIVYLLRRVVRNFFKRKLFTPVQITGLNLIGKLIIIATLIEAGLDFLLNLLIDEKVSLVLSLSSAFDSLLFTLALGLFFILLSKAFNYARNLQQENELTV